MASQQHISPYFRDLARRIEELGGAHNAHLHLDRAGTYEATVKMLQSQGVRDGAALPLPGKHAIIPMIHTSPCYDPAALIDRVEPYVNWMRDNGTSRADTVVDVTADRVGLSALEAMRTLKGRHRDGIDLQLGAYSPFGFRDDEPQRWDLLVEGAASADFIGLLPERDDQKLYPRHIGFAESCRRGIELAHTLQKPIHVHVDQANHQHEAGAETVIEVMRGMGLRPDSSREPLVWLIHLISPSTYDEARFQRLVDNLLAHNIGIICCPSAAISMRQYRPLASPTSNSIARVLELLAAGVPVRIGSDNICDITMPMGSVDMMHELFVLANAIRFYDPDILARIAAGKSLNVAERQTLQAHLAEDAAVVESVVQSFRHEHR